MTLPFEKSLISLVYFRSANSLSSDYRPLLHGLFFTQHTISLRLYVMRLLEYSPQLTIPISRADVIQRRKRQRLASYNIHLLKHVN